MHTTTLRGVFPEPKPVYRRNFIKENVKSIKQMQGILQETGVIQPRNKSVQDRPRNVPKLTQSRESNLNQNLGSLTIQDTNCCKFPSKTSNVTSVRTQLSKATKVKHLPKKEALNTTAYTIEENRLTHRAMQTEREEDLSRLYDTGVIKYPSPGIYKSPKKADKTSVKSTLTGQGDQVDSALQSLENLNIEDKNFIQENKNIKPRPPKQSPVKVMAQAPPTYQRGVVPKYLRDRKEESFPVEIDNECPPGHILLPEEERKETLRVLRQSYADRIQELNMMPVRSDTLRIKKRKMEIEEELKRIDGGIKVFQRPKVFVKINA